MYDCTCMQNAIYITCLVHNQRLTIVQLAGVSAGNHVAPIHLSYNPIDLNDPLKFPVR